jgi:CRISPR-associated protein (TIGR02584 family)
MMPATPTKERILLAVTGLSPQVVTETLYALAVRAEPRWLPTQIHLITTREGAERAKLALLSEHPGGFHRLCGDYDLRGIAFSNEHIHVLPDADGQPLDDIRTPSDNQRAADHITELVRRFTTQETSELHVSIAGGRKTMGYYLGYALSLYGRAQDRLSHVLVSDPFESSWEFFYPTPYSRVITTRDNQLVDTANAQVTLAEIPFVRMRDGLPDGLLKGKARFSAAVDEAQKALPAVSLKLIPAQRMVLAGGETLYMRPAEFALYWLLAARARAGEPGAHWSEENLARELLGYYGRLVNTASGEFERAQAAYQHGLTKDNFDPTKSRINKTLVEALGKRRAAPYLIEAGPALPRGRYKRQQLKLDPSQIEILAPSRP